jgi:hypothetical protein
MHSVSYGKYVVQPGREPELPFFFSIFFPLNFADVLVGISAIYHCVTNHPTGQRLGQALVTAVSQNDDFTYL